MSYGGRAGRPWGMLALVTLGFVSMPVNWFNISTGFDEIAAEFDLRIGSVTLLISIFVAAYGLLHVPGGLLATRWGLRKTLAAGLALEGLGALLSALAPNYPLLMACRAVCGAGASVFAAVGIAACSVWFRERHLATALGVSSAGFSAGTALGLYAWAQLTAALGWRISIALGAALCLATALLCAVCFRVPDGAASLSGVRISGAAIRQALGTRPVWLFGVAFFGAYGAYIAGSQLVTDYGQARGISVAQLGAAAFLIGIAGIPGSIAGGWLADRFVGPRRLFVLGAVLEGAFLLLFLIVGDGVFWLPAAGVGFMFNFTFAVWQSIPGGMGAIAPENIGTAVGLMLTVSAVGGFLIPYGYGLLVPSFGHSAAWALLGFTSIVLGLLGLLGVRQRQASQAAAPAGSSSGDRSPA